VVAALDQARPGIAGRVAPLLGPPSSQGLVTALINELAVEEALLVLDDYHLISSQQVHESLAFLPVSEAGLAVPGPPQEPAGSSQLHSCWPLTFAQV
jgi:hypothetical protein